MKTTDIAIVGGGFAGIYSAWRLAREGAKVTLFEADDHLGGVGLNSREWHGHWLDNGAHNLDLRTQKARDFFSDILGADLKIINEHCWASTIGDHWTHGIESPDFSIDAPDIAQDSLAQLQQLLDTSLHGNATEQATEIALHQWYEKNYGSTLANAIMPMILKVTGSEASSMSAQAVKSLSMFMRTRLGSDQQMISKKEAHDFWNQRLAVTLHCSDDRFVNLKQNNIFGYPAKHGLSGFCQKALIRLRETGVTVRTSEPVTGIKQENAKLLVQTEKQQLGANKMLWTLPDHLLSGLVGLSDDIRQYQIPVGCSMYAFEVPADCVEGPDYLNDFSADTITYRYSHPSRYANDFTADGYGLVLAEVPSHPKNISSLQNETTQERVWQDLISSGYLHLTATYRQATYWPLMVGFTVPCKGFSDSYEQYQQALNSRFSQLYTIKPGMRGRSAFIAAYDDSLHQQLS